MVEHDSTETFPTGTRIKSVVQASGSRLSRIVGTVIRLSRIVDKQSNEWILYYSTINLDCFTVILRTFLSTGRSGFDLCQTPDDTSPLEARRTLEDGGAPSTIFLERNSNFHVVHHLNKAIGTSMIVQISDEFRVVLAD